MRITDLIFPPFPHFVSQLATLSLKPKSSGGASAGTKKRGISAAGDGDDADEPLPTLKQVKEQKDAPPEQLLTFEEKQTPALKVRTGWGGWLYSA